MPIYTICPSFIKACCLYMPLTYQTLVNFVPDNGLRIAIDSKNRALDEYYTVACQDDTGVIGHIMSLLSYADEIAFEKIDIFDNSLIGQELFFTICSSLAFDKKLLCHTKQLYRKFPIQAENITLIDKAEAPKEIHSVLSPNTLVINTASGSSQISNGPYSGNTITKEIL